MLFIVSIAKLSSSDAVSGLHRALAMRNLFLKVRLPTNRRVSWVHASASGLWPASLIFFDHKCQRDGLRT